MLRQARKLSESGYMRLIVRGIGRQIMFEEAADYQRFLSSLEWFCGETGAKKMCLLPGGNHFHLLVCDPKGHTPLMMKKPGVSYSQCFNR